MTPHIALIEDDAVQQVILSSILKKSFNVHVYNGCTEAIRNFRQEGGIKPDLILCDMSLADGDGLMLRRELQKHETLRSCPFIFLTGSEDDHIKRQAIDSGIDDYLKKPIDKHSLLETLERTLKRSRQLQQAGNDRLNQQLNEPLQPYVPERIGPYRLHLAHRQVIAGGGDFVFHLKTKKADFVLIGDIMGHGAPAKFFMHAYAGYLYGLIRSFRHYDITPTAADLLHLLNKTILDDSFLQRWSLTCAVLSLPAEGMPSIAHAGHPFIWLSTSQGLKNITDKSPMPGLMNDARFSNTLFDLKKGDYLLMATDGANIREDTPISSGDLIPQDANPDDDATVLLIECA